MEILRTEAELDLGPHNTRARHDNFLVIKLISHRVGREREARELDVLLAVPLLRVVGPKTYDEDFIKKMGVFVIIPMNISRELILKQINTVLDVYHNGDKLKRHIYSTAMRKIYHGHRYRTTDYDLLLNIWEAKQKQAMRGKEDKKDLWWQIYCDAIGDKALKAELGKGTRQTSDERTKYSKRAQDLYEQAEEMMRNAILGEFPNDDLYQERKKRAKNGNK